MKLILEANAMQMQVYSPQIPGVFYRTARLEIVLKKYFLNVCWLIFE
jgi:hypothetical protein